MKKHKIEFSTHKMGGFSLLEMVMSMAIATVVATLTIDTIKNAAKSERKARDLFDEKSMMHLLMKPISQASKGVVVDTFDPKSTFSGDFKSAKPQNLDNSWNFGTEDSPNDTFEFKHKGSMHSFQRNSHVVDLATADEKMKDTNRGVFIARCVDSKSQKKFMDLSGNLSLAEVKNLKSFPMLAGSGSSASLSCCKLVESSRKIPERKKTKVREQEPYQVAKSVSYKTSRDVPYQVARQEAYQVTRSEAYQVPRQESYQVPVQEAYKVTVKIPYQVRKQVPYQVARTVPYTERYLQTYYETIRVAERVRRTRNVWRWITVPYQVVEGFWSYSYTPYYTWELQYYTVAVTRTQSYCIWGGWWGCYRWGWRTYTTYEWRSRWVLVVRYQSRWVYNTRVVTRHRPERRLVSETYWDTVYRNVQVARQRWATRTRYRTVWETHYRTVWETHYRNEVQTRYRTVYQIRYRTVYDTKYRNITETRYRTVYDTKYRKVWETKTRTEYETAYRTVWKDKWVTEYKTVTDTKLDCSLADEGLDQVARVFRVTNQGVQPWPSMEYADNIVGVGFFRHFDKSENPSSLAVHGFIVKNDCIGNLKKDYPNTSSAAFKRKAKKCPPHKMEVRSELNKVEKSFYDSGIITIGL